MISIKYFIRKKSSVQQREGSEKFLSLRQGSNMHIRAEEDEVGRRGA